LPVLSFAVDALDPLIFWGETFAMVELMIIQRALQRTQNQDFPSLRSSCSLVAVRYGGGAGRVAVPSAKGDPRANRSQSLVRLLILPTPSEFVRARSSLGAAATLTTSTPSGRATSLT
jgi:hypothetical protein